MGGVLILSLNRTSNGKVLLQINVKEKGEQREEGKRTGWDKFYLPENLLPYLKIPIKKVQFTHQYFQWVYAFCCTFVALDIQCENILRANR